METYVYTGTTESLREVANLSKQGVKILCPKCNSELIVALDYETANRHKVHTGIYCISNPKHVHELIELRGPTSRPPLDTPAHDTRNQ